MALCPFAVKRLLPENATSARTDPDQVILHTAVDAPGDTSLYGYFARTDVTLESTFFVKNDGTIEQYMDTTRQADANRYANNRAISIETEDDGRPDIKPWSAAQLAALVRLIDWICDTHPKVLRRQCPAWDQAGIGYHSMWGSPSEWTPVAGKSCPGAARIPQVPGIISAVKRAAAAPVAPIAKDSFLAGLTDAEQRDLYSRVKQLTPFAPERISREGDIVPIGTSASVVTQPWVRWIIQAVTKIRTL